MSLVPLARPGALARTPHRIVHWLCALGLTLGMSRSAAAQPTLTPDIVRDTLLANGMQVIAVRDPSVHWATVVLAIHAGAFTQTTDAQTGIPHLIEHMLFKSFERANGKTWEAAESELQAGFNGGTGEETVTYFLTVPAANVSKAIHLLSDLVRNPRFVDEDLKPETQVVRNELERHVAEPQFLLQFTADQALWGPDWRRKDVGGNVFALSRASSRMLDSLYHIYYTPNNAAIIVSGDVNIADVMAASKQYLTTWKKGPVIPPQTVPMTPLAASQVVPVNMPVSDVTLRVEWQGPSVREDANGAVCAALFAALIDNRSSAFQQHLVDAQLVQRVSIDYEPLNYVGPIILTAHTTPDKLQAASTALVAELKKLTAADAFTDADLQMAKRYWRVSNALEWEQGTGLAHTVAEQWSVGGLASWTGYDAQLNARTAADVNAFVQRYIAGKPRVVGVLIDAGAQQALGGQYQRAMGAWLAK